MPVPSKTRPIPRWKLRLAYYLTLAILPFLNIYHVTAATWACFIDEIDTARLVNRKYRKMAREKLLGEVQ